MTFLNNIEEKIKSYTEQAAQNSNLLNQKTQQIEQLTIDKSTITALLHQLNGALVTLNQVKEDFLKSGTEKAIPESILDVKDVPKES